MLIMLQIMLCESKTRAKTTLCLRLVIVSFENILLVCSFFSFLEKIVPISKVSQQESAQEITTNNEMARLKTVSQTDNLKIVPNEKIAETKPLPKNTTEVLTNKNSILSQTQEAQLSSSSKERKIPSNRTSRVLSFGGRYLFD